jgi:2-polyprenyl-3-methyl-5-hydroxy-6-metoxy-1,4-benzoquinol methylase
MTRSGIAEQQRYYDQRWTQEPFANRLQLRRAIAILNALHDLDLRAPRILDVGCGTGWLSAVLGRFGPTTGVDLSAVAIEAAQIRYPDVRYLTVDISAGFPLDETFDVVVSQEVIEHVEDQPGHVGLCARALRPGGHVILTTPNAWNLAHWSREAVEAWGLQPIESWLTRRELRTLLDPHFRMIRLSTIIPGQGTRGVFRCVNAPKLRYVLAAVGAEGRYDRILEQAGFGLHLLAVAERR